MSRLDQIAQEQPHYAGACYAVLRSLDTLDGNTRAVLLALTPDALWQLVALVVARCSTVQDVEEQLPALIREVIP